MKQSRLSENHIFQCVEDFHMCLNNHLETGTSPQTGNSTNFLWLKSNKNTIYFYNMPPQK